MDMPAEIDAYQLEHAVDVLHRGGIVAFPTETVYGLGALVEHPSAVAAIFDVKGRPRFDPLIVHVADVQQAEQLDHGRHVEMPLNQFCEWNVMRQLDAFQPDHFTDQSRSRSDRGHDDRACGIAGISGVVVHHWDAPEH